MALGEGYPPRVRVLLRILALVLAACAVGVACTSGATTDEGGCGPCAGSCIDGRCVCPAWHSPCGAACVDLVSDPKNCGWCGEDCGEGFCVAGACQAACGLTPCPGKRCVDLTTSNANCGACDVVCGAGQTCKAGVCASPAKVDPPPTCPAGQTLCGTGCFDLTANLSHCGDCARACPPASVSCSGGACNCGSGLRYCAKTNVCVNTQGSLLNCGDCYVACTGTNPRCCGGGCKDIAWNEQHCGSCEHACGTGKVCCRGDCVIKGTCK